MTKRSKQDNPLLAAGLVGVLGVDVAVCIVLGYWGGTFAGNYFGGGKAWTIGGLLVGLAVGILSAILLVRKVMEDADG